VVIDGEEKSLRERIVLSKNDRHDIDVIVDEIFVSEFTDDPKGSRERASEAIERALHESEGLIRVTEADGSSHIASAKFMCAYDGFSFPEVEPRLFSFNSPYGACPECKGLGTKYLLVTRHALYAPARVSVTRRSMYFSAQSKSRRNIMPARRVPISSPFRRFPSRTR